MRAGFALLVDVEGALRDQRVGVVQRDVAGFGEHFGQPGVDDRAAEVGVGEDHEVAHLFLRLTPSHFGLGALSRLRRAG
ncbi:hypothetical protein [Jeongeupia naejangsanensis]|uniref:hypothetical protein n=1 Tax=Jeongeupia naejangsanensis TaxID=613195 RepID=UPI001EF0E209|nr:hypothetical protein [Jeongeupia naejangsanensis]